MPLPTHPRESYTVGITCALDVEKAVVEATLDEEHGGVEKMTGGENSYNFGRIGEHNVVVASLPAGVTGKAPAAIAALDMMRSSPIKAGFMVGIGGGVWSDKADVRLGNVVVSQPDGMHGGVVQWDFGKMEREGLFRAYAQSLLTLGELAEATIIHSEAEAFVESENWGRWEDTLGILGGLTTLEEVDKETPEHNSNTSDGTSSALTVSAKDFCGKLLSTGIKVKLAHFTVKEYLESARILEGSATGFHLDSNKEHRCLSQRCLFYIMHYNSSSEKM
ncbi:hypothetical protein LTR49_028228 [Elasticomyces elasticus]|nr:hypothetical protein LTR49_028228 [Elasticomyces elasticus]